MEAYPYVTVEAMLSLAGEETSIDFFTLREDRLNAWHSSL
jgi:hypothetical protein